MDKDRLQKLQKEVDLLVKEKELLEEIYALRKMLEKDKEIVYVPITYPYPKIYDPYYPVWQPYITSDDTSFNWNSSDCTIN